MKIFLFICISVLSALILFQYKTSSNERIQIEHYADQQMTSLDKNHEITRTRHEKEADENLVEVTPDQASSGNFSSANQAVRNWYANRGDDPVFDSNNNMYASYSNDAIDQLANNGDIYAIRELAKRIGKGEIRDAGLDRLREIFWKAAVYGSTWGIKRYAKLEMVGFSSLENSNLPENKDKIIHALALLNVAGMRGDKLALLKDANTIIQMNKVELNEEDINKILTLSQQYYKKLEYERTSLGLDKFDNSIPEEVEAYFAMYSESLDLSYPF